MRGLGFEWTPCMQVGQGCRVHLRANELPAGHLVVSLSKHWAAVIDGVVHDNGDPSRNGTRCVYGYWKLNQDNPDSSTSTDPDKETPCENSTDSKPKAEQPKPQAAPPESCESASANGPANSASEPAFNRPSPEPAEPSARPDQEPQPCVKPSKTPATAEPSSSPKPQTSPDASKSQSDESENATKPSSTSKGSSTKSAKPTAPSVEPVENIWPNCNTEKPKNPSSAGSKVPKTEPGLGGPRPEVVDETSTDPAAGLIPRGTVTDIVTARDAAVALYGEFFDAMGEAHKILAKADEMAARACGGSFSWPFVARNQYGGEVQEVAEFHNAIKPPNVEQYRRVARRLVDIGVWGHVVGHTDLEMLMDAKAKAELREQMEYIPEQTGKDGELINQEEIAKGLPPVTEDAILGTLEKFAEDAGMIWRRGIAEAFSALDRRFRSHDGFKVGSRVILTHCFGTHGDFSYGATRDRLIDIERVFLVLDGKKPTATYAGIVGKVAEERSAEAPGWGETFQSEHQGDYFKVRAFKNGNAHLWFTRPDLVEKVNLLLAEYYGDTLGTGKAEVEPDPERVFEGAMERAPAKNYGLFPTPDELAEKVIDEAQLYSEEPLSILEPSAGPGALASRAAEPVEYGGWQEEKRKVHHRVDVVEVQPDLASKLRSSGKYARTFPRDFLKMEPNGTRYDRVVMNPPFDRLRDVDHVNHALKFLKPGGRLVAIMSASAEFSQQAKAEAFRAKVKKWGGRFTDLPAGSFAPATNVNTVLLKVTRPSKG